MSIEGGVEAGIRARSGTAYADGAHAHLELHGVDHICVATIRWFRWMVSSAENRASNLIPLPLREGFASCGTSIYVCSFPHILHGLFQTYVSRFQYETCHFDLVGASEPHSLWKPPSA